MVDLNLKASVIMLNVNDKNVLIKDKYCQIGYK